MDSFQYYIQKLDESQTEDAYYYLIEAGAAIIPELITAYKSEITLRKRLLLVEIIGRCNADSAIHFTAQALTETEPEIWKAALDALVGLKIPISLELLVNEKKRLLELNDRHRLEWIEEAIQQLQDNLLI